MGEIYNRKELKLVIYESGENAILVVTNDEWPSEPMIFTGERAQKIVLDLMAALND